MPADAEPAIAGAMTNNDVLRSVRYILDASDGRMVDILALGGGVATIEAMRTYLFDEGDSRGVPMNDRLMAQFLNGLVIARRGHQEGRPPPPLESHASNNVVLKKLRVAFELKDVDLHAIFASTGFQVTKPELSAFFRNPGHPHYRLCQDQYLRAFLKGLAMRVRAPTPAAPGTRR